MKNEFMPSKREAAATQKRLETIDTELDELTLERDIFERLIKEGLREPSDEFDEDLIRQYEAIRNQLYIYSKPETLEVLTLGYEIDTEIQNGSGIGQIVLSIASDLTDIAEVALRHDFPNVTKAEAELTVGRAVDTYTPNQKFLDVFLTAIDERRRMMSTTTGGTYTLDGRTGVVEQVSKKD